MNQNTKISSFAVIILLAGCGPRISQMESEKPSATPIFTAESTPSTETGSNNPEIENYLGAMTDWSQLAPEKEEGTKERAGQQIVTNKIDETPSGPLPSQCQIKTFDLTKTPEKIVMQNPAANVLYPGALIQGKGYLSGPGGLAEVAIRKRAPMTLVTDLSTNANAIVMENFNFGSYQMAFNKILDAGARDIDVTPANFSYKQIQANGSRQAALDLGFSVKYLGNSLTGDLKASTSSSEKMYMVVFEHRAFTMSVVSPATPAGYFSGDLKLADLKQQEAQGTIGPNNPMLYVSSVTYGRMLMFTIKSKASKTDIQGALKGAYNSGVSKGKLTLDAKYKKILNESSVSVFTLGGATKNAEALIRSGRLDDYFTDTPNLKSMVPLSYVIRNLKDNSIAKVSETTEYQTEECVALPPVSWNVTVTVEKILMKYTGAIKRGEIYGNLSLNGFTIWNREREQYATTKNGENLSSQTSQTPLTFLLPVDSYKPIRVTGVLKDNDWLGDSVFSDELIASFEAEIGYTIDHREVQAPGLYVIDSQKNVEIHYRIDRTPNYAPASSNLKKKK